MRKHVLLCLILSLGFHFYGTAQGGTPVGTVRNLSYIFDLPPGYNKIIVTDSHEKGIDGSPWLSENWQSGTLELTNGKIINGLEYKYNVYRNKMYFMTKNTAYEVGAPDSIQALTLESKRFVYACPDPMAKDRKRFLEIAVDGKARMYVNYYPVMIQANYNKALGSGNVNEQMIIKEAYLIKIGPVMTMVDKKVKLLPLAFADREAEIRAFMEKEKISVIKRRSVEKVVRYYNSLK